jgi:predicted Rossmann fold flavoprotein
MFTDYLSLPLVYNGQMIMTFTIKSNKSDVFDVVIIGGGPAGMLSAGRAAELGANVILLEKNARLGRKLLITGNGRCNLTQAEYNIRDMVEKFGENGKFLFSSLSTFGVKETIEFFNDLGCKTKVERGDRVFPESDKAQDVLDVLVKYMAENSVTVSCSSEVMSLEKEDNRITRLITNKGEIIAKNYVICTGGKSFPGTGSTGDGFKWVEKLGHHVTELTPSLTALNIKEDWVKSLQGLSLKNIEVSILQNDTKKESIFGEMLFTHFGISGPIILSISKNVGKLLKKGKVTLSLDLKPALDFIKLDKRLQRDFLKYQNKIFKNSLDELLPQNLIPIIIDQSGIDPDKYVNSITKEERHRLLNLLKSLNMTVTSLQSFEHSLITSGGVAIKEIDPKTMRSKLIENLFFAGEIIDVDGPTGGYNLQVCWSTGYVAGENSANFAQRKS